MHSLLWGSLKTVQKYVGKDDAVVLDTPHHLVSEVGWASQKKVAHLPRM